MEETLQAQIDVRLTDRSGRVILDDLGTSAGVEVHGETDRLIRMGT